MSHSTKVPSIAKSTSGLPTDVEDGTTAYDTTQNTLVVRVGGAWEKAGGAGAATPTVVYDDGTAVGNTDQIQGDIPSSWKNADASLKGLVIGTSCTSIGGNAFYNCNSLTGSLVIPDSVTGIQISAFRYCTGFNSELKLSNNLKFTDALCFDGCNFTGSLNIPDSVTGLGNSWIRDNDFTDVNIGSGYGFIPSYQHFQGLDSLTGIFVNNGNPYLSTDVNNSLLFDDTKSKIYSFARATSYGDVVIPNSVQSIQGEVALFKTSTSITSIVFSENLTGHLPDFYDCTNLAGTITIPSGITRINNFTNTQISGTVSMPAGITYIQYQAFENCSGIERFEIHATTAPSYIGGQAFLNTSPTDGKIHVPVGAVGYAASYNGLTVAYDL